jgi:hypothetical protein
MRQSAAVRIYPEQNIDRKADLYKPVDPMFMAMSDLTELTLQGVA